MEHTPVPWTIQNANDNYTQYQIEAKGWGIIARVEDISNESHANAQFIVSACNCHEELLETLERLLLECETNNDFAAECEGPEWDAMEAAKAAIAKAKRN